MDKQYFLELLHKYLNGEVTDVEQQFLLKYYELFQAEPDIIALLGIEQKEALKNEIRASVWQSIEGDSERGKKTIHLKPWFLKLAAAAVIIGVCVTGFLFLRNHPGNEPAPLYAAHKQKSNLFIVLPDGSRVILSYGSKLSYASSFDGLAKRDVYLEGQAFFDIRHNDLKPFIVHTGKLETIVLGTAFNVKALKDDKTITVTVTRGRVKVSEPNKILGIIIPNQQIIYNTQKSNSVQNTIDAKIYTGWSAQSDLHFENVTVAEAAKIIEGRFNVKILFSDQLVKSKHFTSTFGKSASLEQELKSICIFNDAVYSYDKEKAIITITGKTN